jgi:hypothetical protein
MRILVAVSITWISAISMASGQNTEPTKPEIAEAYRSKSGEHGLPVPGFRWETWRIREIRGWALKFRRLSEKEDVGVMTRRYLVVAKKGGSCSEYQVTDMGPSFGGNAQIRPILNVEARGVGNCR